MRSERMEMAFKERIFRIIEFPVFVGYTFF